MPFNKIYIVPLRYYWPYGSKVTQWVDKRYDSYNCLNNRGGHKIDPKGKSAIISFDLDVV